MITKSHFITPTGDNISVYWFEDRYRYTVNSIEYREVIMDPCYTNEKLHELVLNDIRNYPYQSQQLKSRCIRCSKQHGVPRKEYNLAPICNRCRSAMNDTSVSGASVFYEINQDGSKGSVIKD